VIRTENLSKSYGKTEALRAVDLAVSRGVLGLLGPNGAGKTTLMRILATLLLPSSGTASVLGFDVVKNRTPIRRQLGYLPQEYGAYPKLTGREYLRYIAHLKGLHGANRLVSTSLAAMDLTDVASRSVSSYSGGMLRRIGIAQALLGNPQVLLIDEPTSSLDPEQRVAFRELLLRLAETRLSILSTHLVEDVALVSGDLAVLRGGKLAFRGTPDELRRRYEGEVTEVVLDESAVPAFLHRHRKTVLSTSRHSDQERAVRLLEGQGEGRSVTPTLEDAYLALLRS